MNYTGIKEVIHSVFRGSGGGVGRMTVGGGGGGRGGGTDQELSYCGRD